MSVTVFLKMLLLGLVLIFLGFALLILTVRYSALDYRRYFDLERDHHGDCIVLAEKPKYPIAGNIIVLHCTPPDSAWEMLRLDCERWVLERVCALPAQFDTTHPPRLLWADRSGEEFWLTYMVGDNHAFWSFEAPNGRAEWHVVTEKECLMNAQRLGNYAYCVIEDEASADDDANSRKPERLTLADLSQEALSDTPRPGLLPPQVRWTYPDSTIYRIDLHTGDIDKNILQRILPDKNVVRCGAMRVEYFADDMESLFFSVEWVDDTSTHTGIFRLDADETLAVPAEGHTPARLSGFGERLPASSDDTWFDLVTRTRMVWSGTMDDWSTLDPEDSLGLSMFGFDLKRLGDRRPLVRMPFSWGDLSFLPCCPSPDGRYQVFWQHSTKPEDAEGFVAIDMQTGISLPLLAHYLHPKIDPLDLSWR